MIRYRYNQQVAPPAPYVHVSISRLDASGAAQTLPALVDSGADRTVVPTSLVDELGLPQAGLIEVAGLNQITLMMPVFLVLLRIGDLPPVATDVIAAAGEDHVLLGRDVLNGHRVTLDGPGLLFTIDAP